MNRFAMFAAIGGVVTMAAGAASAASPAQPKPWTVYGDLNQGPPPSASKEISGPQVSIGNLPIGLDAPVIPAYSNRAYVVQGGQPMNGKELPLGPASQSE
jgi:hypothetical protein